MKKGKVNQVATFEKFLGFCNTQSAVYKPSKVSIQLAALSTLLTQAQQSLKAADASQIAYENARNARQPVFKTIPKVAGRVIDAMIASGASQEVVRDLRSIKRKLSSQAKVLITSPDQPTLPDGTAQGETFRRRISQLDLANKVENFERLVSRVILEPVYKPNEPELNLAGLTAFVVQLKTLNRNVINSYGPMRNAKRILNGVLYNATGIYGISRTAKAYIRSVFGKGSDQDKEIISYKIDKR